MAFQTSWEEVAIQLFLSFVFMILMK